MSAAQEVFRHLEAIGATELARSVEVGRVVLAWELSP